MNIEKTMNGSTLTVKPEGRLDTATAPELDKALKDLDGVEELILDFEQLEYISSGGLRVLLAAEQSMEDRGSRKLINVNEHIMEIFDITGFADILDIE